MKKALALLICAAMFAMLIPVGIASGSGSQVWAERMVPGLDEEIRAIWFEDHYASQRDEAAGRILERNGNSNYLWKTQNGGATWTKGTVYPTGTFLPLGDFIDIRDVAFTSDGQTGWAVGEYRDRQGTLPPYTYEYSPYILYTNDHGTTWSNQTTNLDTDLTGDGALNAVHIDDTGFVLTAGENGTLIATDSGGTTAGSWEVVAHSNPGVVFNDVAAGTDTGVIRAVGVAEDREIFYFEYTTASSTWGVANAATSALSSYDFTGVIWEDGTKNLLAVGVHGLYAYSEDRGETWTIENTGGDEGWQALAPWTTTWAYAVGYQGQLARFWWGDDGGWAYHPTDTGPASGPTGVAQHLRAVHALGLDRVYAGGDVGTIVEYNTSSTERISDDNRYTTAIAMSSDWPDDSCDTVVLATGLDFPDALSASALAGTHECPLLLTGATLDSKVKNEITRLGADTVVIVGGTAAVPAAVSNALTSAGFTVERLAGTNRYHTAELVAREIADEEGASFSKAAFIARGDGFADALAVSPFAYSQKIPVLLTTTKIAPIETQRAITDLDIEDAVVAGGTSAVSDPVRAGLEVLIFNNGGSLIDRWWGSNRYKTATEVARNGISKGWGTSAFVGLATGTNFPDALGGGAVAGSSGGVLLLTDSATLSSDTETFLEDYSGDILEIEVFGGTGAVSESVMNAADAAID